MMTKQFYQALVFTVSLLAFGKTPLWATFDYEIQVDAPNSKVRITDQNDTIQTLSFGKTLEGDFGILATNATGQLTLSGKSRQSLKVTSTVQVSLQNYTADSLALETPHARLTNCTLQNFDAHTDTLETFGDTKIFGTHGFKINQLSTEGTLSLKDVTVEVQNFYLMQNAALYSFSGLTFLFKTIENHGRIISRTDYLLATLKDDLNLGHIQAKTIDLQIPETLSPYPEVWKSTMSAKTLQVNGSTYRTLSNYFHAQLGENTTQPDLHSIGLSPKNQSGWFWVKELDDTRVEVSGFELKPDTYFATKVLENANKTPKEPGNQYNFEVGEKTIAEFIQTELPKQTYTLTLLGTSTSQYGAVVNFKSLELHLVYQVANNNTNEFLKVVSSHGTGPPKGPTHGRATWMFNTRTQTSYDADWPVWFARYFD